MIILIHLNYEYDEYLSILIFRNAKINDPFLSTELQTNQKEDGFTWKNF